MRRCRHLNFKCFRALAAAQGQGHEKGKLQKKKRAEV